MTSPADAVPFEDVPCEEQAPYPPEPDGKYAPGGGQDEPGVEELLDRDDLDGPELAKAVILAESVERTEHPEETGAESSQTIPEI